MYRILCNHEEFSQFIADVTTENDISPIYLIHIPVPPSYPCLLEVSANIPYTGYEYTEVCDLEGCTKTKYLDADPEYVNLMMIARDMMFRRIEDSSNGV